MSGGGSSSPSPPSQQTVVQTQQIPQYAQDFSQENMNIARQIAAQPFPTYQGQRIADFTPQQQQSFGMVGQGATAYQPGLNQAQGMTSQSAQGWNPQSAQNYMSPYVMASLQPQLQQLGIQQSQNQQGIDAQANQAGAFGDARHGVQSSLNNFYGGLQQQDLIGQGFNNAYNSGLGAFQNDQARMLAAGGQQGQLAEQQQSDALTGANALFQSGGQQQQQTQGNLNQAFTDFMNQVNWGPEMLNLRTSVLANSPYNSTRLNVSPPPNTTAQNLGAFGALAGGLGSLFGGSSSTGAKSIYG